MTIDESIEVLICHKLHWEHLLEQKICDAHEGKETISALTTAIASLEAWEKIRQEIKELASADTVDVLVDVMRIINRHLGEVTT